MASMFLYHLAALATVPVAALERRQADALAIRSPVFLANASSQPNETGSAANDTGDAVVDGDQSLHDKIMQYGRQLCNGTHAGHPSCKTFEQKQDWESDLLSDEKINISNVTNITRTTSQAPSTSTIANQTSITSTTSPAPSTTTSTTSTAPSTTTSSTAAPAPTTTATPAVTPVAQPMEGLPEQGFDGPPVKHAHGKTSSDDWHREYPHAGMESGTQQSGARWGSASGSALAAAAALACLSMAWEMYR